MYCFRFSLTAVTLACGVVGVALAQPSPAPVAARPTRVRADTGDSTLETLITPDSAMRLTLTRRTFRVGFTPQGQLRIRRAADSAFGARDPRAVPGTRAPRARDADATYADARPDKPIPLRGVERVRASGDSLLVCFTARRGTAEPPCGLWRRILVTGLAPADAQHFAAAVRRAQADLADARE